jgi:hypothetical protein
MSTNGVRNVKLLAAAAGGVAVLAFSVLGVAAEGTASAKGSKMNIGSTSTDTTPPTAPMISMAVPQIKGPATLPPEEKAAE